jgi:uncharacterized protein with HEPN domain
MPQRDPGVYLEDICGEAMSNLYRVAPAVAETIPHARDIIGFRNILAHGYAELDHNKVYNIAIAHAPQLLLAVREALKAFPDPPSLADPKTPSFK